MDAISKEIIETHNRKFLNIMQDIDEYTAACLAYPAVEQKPDSKEYWDVIIDKVKLVLSEAETARLQIDHPGWVQPHGEIDTILRQDERGRTIISVTKIASASGEIGYLIHGPNYPTFFSYNSSLEDVILSVEADVDNNQLK